LLALLPSGPPLYDEDTLTDRTERFLAAELIREQIVLRLWQELPYATAVVVDGWEERAEQGDVVVDATIVVDQGSRSDCSGSRPDETLSAAQRPGCLTDRVGGAWWLRGLALVPKPAQARGV